MPPWARVHRDRLPLRRDPRGDALFRPARRDAGAVARAGHQRARHAGLPVAVRHGGVLPVGRERRRDQLPAQLLDRRGRGDRRRHLPQDRVPGAAQPLRLVRLLRAAGGIRHTARRIHRAVPRLGSTARGRAWSVREHNRERLAAHRSAPRAACTCAGRDAGHRLRAGLLREPSRRQVRSAGFVDDRSASGRCRHRAVPPGRCGRRGIPAAV